MATTVKDLLTVKGSQVWTIDVEMTIKQALLLMAEKQIGAVPVLKDGKICGIFSERDMVNFVAETGLIETSQPVSKLMVHPVYYVRPDQTIEECMSLITAKRLRHLPVMENDKLVGMVTVGDILKRLIVLKEGQIKNLEYFAWTNIIG